MASRQRHKNSDSYVIKNGVTVEGDLSATNVSGSDITATNTVTTPSLANNPTNTSIVIPVVNTTYTLQPNYEMTVCQPALGTTLTITINSPSSPYGKRNLILNIGTGEVILTGAALGSGGLYLNTIKIGRHGSVVLENYTSSYAVVELDNGNNHIYGDGSDGDVTISGALTLTRDMFYRNLSLVAGCAIDTAGYRIFIQNVLDISSAPSNSVRANSGTANSGGNGSAGSGGSLGGAGSAFAGGTIGGSPGGTAGGAGVLTGSGDAGGNAATPYSCHAGQSGAGGAGGNGSSGSGGTAGSNTTGNSKNQFHRFELETRLLTNILNGGTSGGGGGGGSGDTTNGGGGGGAGAASGRIGIVAARVISKGSNVNTGIFVAEGGQGGAGGNGHTTGNTGGGGGGGGGTGGTFLVYCDFLYGAVITNAINVTGGNGGNGGNANGSGTVGSGGAGGGGGHAFVLAARQKITYISGTVGPVSGSGQTGGTATSSQINL